MTVIDYFEEYPTDQDEHCGLYGYNLTYSDCKFIGNSNRFYLVLSEIKGQNRVLIADTQMPGSVKWLNFLNKPKANFRDGNYDLLGF